MPTWHTKQRCLWLLALGHVPMRRGQLPFVGGPRAQVTGQILRSLEHRAQHLAEEALRQDVGVL